MCFQKRKPWRIYICIAHVLIVLLAEVMISQKKNQRKLSDQTGLSGDGLKFAREA